MREKFTEILKFKVTFTPRMLCETGPRIALLDLLSIMCYQFPWRRFVILQVLLGDTELVMGMFSSFLPGIQSI